MSCDFSPRRIVSLQPSITVILERLEELDRLVACTRYCADVCAAVREKRLPLVHDSWTANTGEITRHRPDLVMASVPYQLDSLAAILKTGVPVLALAPRSLRDIYSDIALIAAITGAAERGARVIAAMQRDIAAVAARLPPDAPPPLVFCEEWGKPLIHSQPWVAELVTAAGGRFLGNPGEQVAPEDVRRADPDVVVMAWCGAGDRVPLEKVIRQRGWSDLRAVRRGRVYCVSDELLNTPAPTLVEGLRALAAAIHPDVFPPVAGLRRMTPAASPSVV